MTQQISASEIPAGSEITRYVPGAHLHDCYDLPVESAAPSALQTYLGVVARTPAWVNRLMLIRNRAVALVGLKNLGQLGEVDPNKPASAYRVGDRVGIFSVLYLTDEEVILGDSDRHLSVKLSVYKRPEGDRHSVAVSTVVHIKNGLGHFYMFFVTPLHKLILPAMLARALPATRDT